MKKIAEEVAYVKYKVVKYNKKTKLPKVKYPKKDTTYYCKIKKDNKTIYLTYLYSDKFYLIDKTTMQPLFLEERSD